MIIEIADNLVAGWTLVIVCCAFAAWYLFVLTGIWRLARKHSSFVFFFSQAFGDLGLVWNTIWLGVEIIIGPSSLLPDHLNFPLYSYILNISERPALFHFPIIACNRFVAVAYPLQFEKFFSRKRSICICVAIWLCTWVEITVWHLLYPVDAYLSHNIEWYAFMSKNFTFYQSTPLPTYLTAHNVVIASLSFSFYVGAIIFLRKKTNRTEIEVKLFLYCLINNVTFFVPTVVLTIVAVGSKWGMLVVMLGLVLSFQLSALLLPVFSTELHETLFGKKQSQQLTTIRSRLLHGRLSNTVSHGLANSEAELVNKLDIRDIKRRRSEIIHVK